jgi:hypothetical protein
MAELETLLQSRDIQFDVHNHRITCFAHTIDLATKAVILKANGESQGSPVTLAHKVVQAI